MMKPFILISVIAMTLSSNVRAELPPLIPRELLFGNPERTSPQLSPDGTRLAWLAPDTNNVLQVWVQGLQEGASAAKPVTADKRRGIRRYLWAKDNRTLLYMQDSDGDENWHVYGVDLPSGNIRDYTPFQGVRAGVVDLNPDFPSEVLLELNLRTRELRRAPAKSQNRGLEPDTENPAISLAGALTQSSACVLASFPRLTAAPRSGFAKRSPQIGNR
jgi:hypothetical protein